MSFEGHPERACREHHTVGDHRAWCFDCSEWCYPSDGCRGCKQPLVLQPGQRHDYDWGHIQNDSTQPVTIWTEQ